MQEAFSSPPQQELSHRLLDLLNSLSALRGLIMIDVHAISEATLIRNALKTLMQNQDMGRCSVFLHQDGDLINAAGIDWQELYSNDEETRLRECSAKAQRFKLGEGVIGQAALTRSLQHCHDCHNDARFYIQPGTDKTLLPGSLICAPIESGGVLLGVLNISHPEPYYFNEWHERLLIIYCAMLAQLMVNCRLFHQLDAEIAGRTRQLEEALAQAHRLKQKFESLSMTDDLTGLYNRRYFFPQAERALANAQRYELNFSILLLDIDYFKRINDHYGHKTGDAVLSRIAKVLENEIRKGDILARIGGEEFVIAAASLDRSTCYALAERIRNAIAGLKWQQCGEQFRVTVSIGLSWLASPQISKIPSFNHLLHQADMALYAAKGSGRNQVIVYQEEQGN